MASFFSDIDPPAPAHPAPRRPAPVWIRGRVGTLDRQDIVFGNTRPPWPEDPGPTGN